MNEKTKINEVEDEVTSPKPFKVLDLKQSDYGVCPMPFLDGRPVPVKNVKDASKLLGRLIKHFQEGTVESSFAKTLCYLLQTFVNIHAQSSLEERIERLENMKGT